MRYGALKLGRRKTLDNDTVLDLYEHVFRTNVGDSIDDFMKALSELKEDPTLKDELILKEATVDTEDPSSDSDSD